MTGRPPFHFISRSNLSELSVDRPETGVQRSGYQFDRYHLTAPTSTTREYSLPGSATRSCSLQSPAVSITRLPGSPTTRRYTGEYLNRRS
ncbi:hypothetical protein evm_006356 [Chilo suppressalis]|nr:hypothetical protein evm_006356 [Chilo suppressalis]